MHVNRNSCLLRHFRIVCKKILHNTYVAYICMFCDSDALDQSPAVAVTTGRAVSGPGRPEGIFFRAKSAYFGTYFRKMTNFYKSREFSYSVTKTWNYRNGIYFKRNKISDCFSSHPAESGRNTVRVRERKKVFRVRSNQGY